MVKTVGAYLNRKSEQTGFTVIELICMLAVVTILSAIAISNLRDMNNAAARASFSLNNFLHLARSQAIASTFAVEVRVDSAMQVQAFSGASCLDPEAMEELPGLFLELPTGAQFTDLDSSVCFTSRGLANDSSVFSLNDTNGQQRRVEIALGGGTRVVIPGKADN